MSEQGNAMDDAFVQSPALARMVELARAQRVPPSTLDAAGLAAAVRRRRSVRNRNVVLTAVALAAGVAALWFGLERRRLELDADATPDAAANVVAYPERERDAAVREHGGRGDAGGPTRDATRDSAVSTAAVPAPTPAGEATAPDAGTPEALAEPPDERAAAAPASASELSRQAEAAMIEHRRRDAIQLLTQLVRRYPTHAAARTALLDLGRLLREGKRDDEARCAYRQFIARWPGDSTRADVERALAALGDGPECRGLRPRR